MDEMDELEEMDELDEAEIDDSEESVSSSWIPFEIIKWALLAVILLFLFFQLFSQHQSNADFSDVSTAVLSSADLSTMEESDNQMVKRIFGLSPSDYDGVLYYAPASTMDVTEVLVIKLSDMNQQSGVEDAMNQRITDQIDVFDGYGPEQVDLLEHAVVSVEGNYLLLVVAEDPSPVVAAFKDAL